MIRPRRGEVRSFLGVRKTVDMWRSGTHGIDFENALARRYSVYIWCMSEKEAVHDLMSIKYVRLHEYKN
jgi:hypothetical protein